MLKRLLPALLLISLSIGLYLAEKNPLGNNEPDTTATLPKTLPTQEILSPPNNTVYQGDANSRLQQRFAAAKVDFPPTSITFLAIKNTGMLELWTNEKDKKHFVSTFPIKAQSGIAGPKLREGDRQVPEGIYQITWLHPNSSYHRSMKINYPNTFDRMHAKNEGRTEPGTNIFIHGRAVSIGCLAMGDPAIEELYLLVQKVGTENANIIIAPTDPRRSRIQRLTHIPWTDDLYSNIETAFQQYIQPEELKETRR